MLGTGFLVAVSRAGGFFAVVCGLPIAVPSLVAEHRSRRWASLVVVHGLSCSAACGIFPDQGIEPVSPALAGGFLSVASPGKPYSSLLILDIQ